MAPLEPKFYVLSGLNLPSGEKIPWFLGLLSVPLHARVACSNKAGTAISSAKAPPLALELNAP